MRFDDVAQPTVGLRVDSAVLAPDDRMGFGAALRQAARVGSAPLVRCLLGANVSALYADPQARTAMTLASQSGHADVVAILMEHDPHGWQRKDIDSCDACDLMELSFPELGGQLLLKSARAFLLGGPLYMYVWPKPGYCSRYITGGPAAGLLLLLLPTA